jgi:putative phosphoesterase
MRIAAIYDIHGNLPALEAVLGEIRAAKVDRIVVGGDVLPGPMPAEALQCLQALEIPTQYIYGNCETAVLQQMTGEEPRGVPKTFRPIIEWTAQQVSERDRRWMAEWPKTLGIAHPELGAVLFCHATPRNENENFTRLTPEEKLAPIFATAGTDIVVCGHTHMQFDRKIGRVRVVNAGSVGMPWGEPGAYWLLLGPRVELRRTMYDFAAAAERVRRSNYPQAEQFAANNILQPPPEAQMLDLLSKAELI